MTQAVRIAFVALMFVAGALTLSGAPSWAQSRTPLLMAGKTTLYQRVLTRPDAVLRTAPSRAAIVALDPVAPFSVFYVYDRVTVSGDQWLEVGRASRGPVDGWVRAEMTVRWDTTMTVAFANPANRQRTLLFAERDGLVDLLTAPDAAAQAAALRAQLEAGDYGAEFPVISIEPETFVDIRRQFYLLPILSADEVFMDSGFTSRVLEVASVTLPKNTAEDADAEARAALVANYRAGVTFVIDTTTSMGPYIERTREAIRSIYDQLRDAGVLGEVSFGLVAFRDNTGAAPGLDYVSRTYADLQTGADPLRFFDQVAAVAPAPVSSQGFVEDAFSGVVTAVSEMPWDQFGGRYIILITDAGARRGADPLSATGLDAEQVRQLALDQGVAVYTLHLLTEIGRENHEAAAAQYTTLSTYPGLERALYYPVEAGDVDRFGRVVDALGAALAEQVINAEAQLAASQPPVVRNSEDPQIDQLASEANLIGHAMMLAYLGREEGVQAPSVFRAWAADRDIDNPSIAALDVRVLLSKTQLSDLQAVLKAIVEAARLGQISPQDFFDQLRSATLALSRDPNRVGRAEARNLADLGLVGEYLEGLPYESKIMSIDQDLWASWSVGEQQAFIDEVEAKIRLYQAYHDDVDRWIAFDGGRVPGDAVYPVPLEALP